MITDKMLAEAAAELNATMLDSLPDPAECRHTFSKHFERKMKRIIRRANHPVGYHIMHRAASFILVLFLSFMTLLALSPSVRAAFFGWIQAQYDYYTHFYFSSGTAQYNKPADYELDLLPDGYKAFKEMKLPKNTTKSYANHSTNEIIYFTYSLDSDSIEYFYEFDEYSFEEVRVNDKVAKFYDAHDPSIANIIQWSDASTNTFLSISGFLEREELILMAENVKKIN